MRTTKFPTLNDARTNGSLDVPRNRPAHYLLALGVAAFFGAALAFYL